MALPVTLTTLKTYTPAPVGPFRAKNATLQINQPVSSGTQPIASAGVNSEHYAGQTFYCTKAFLLKSLRVKMWKVGTPSANLNVTLHDGNAPNAAQIGSFGAIDHTALGTATGPALELVLATPIQLVEGRYYTIKFHKPGFGNSANYYVTEITPTIEMYGGMFWTGDTSNMNDTDSTLLFSLSAVNSYNTSNEKYFIIGQDVVTATRLRISQSTDPTNTWSNTTYKDGFSAAVRFIAAVQDGNIIHLAVMDGMYNTTNLKYLTFNTDTYELTDPVIVHGPYDHSDYNGSDIWDCSICLQNGLPTILYNGPGASVMGTRYAKIFERHMLAGGTWSAGQLVDPNASDRYMRPRIVAGTGGAVHCLFHMVNTPTFYQRTMNSAYALQTATVLATAPAPQQAISYVRGTTTKVICSTTTNWAVRGDSYVTTLGLQNIVLANASMPSRAFNDGTDAYILTA